MPPRILSSTFQRALTHWPQILALLFLLAVLAGFLWWNDSPSQPLEGLGFDSSAQQAAAANLAEDLEQQAFLERRKLEIARQEPRSTGAEAPDATQTGGSRGVTLTDWNLVHQLSGRWRLDLGRGRVVADFAPVVVDRVRRGALLVELFAVSADGLPSYFTPLELPERGTFLAFSTREGDYRLVLEGVRSQGLDTLSYRISGFPRRLEARRLGKAPSAPHSEDDERFQTPSRRPRDQGRVTEPVEIIVEAPPPATELWQRARELREQEKVHTLDSHLRRMLQLHPTHSPARRWKKRVPSWIRDQERSLSRAVSRRLKDLVEAIEDQDLGDVEDAWDDALPAESRRFFRDLFKRHPRLRARTQLHTIRVQDGVAEFHVTFTIEGTDKGRRGVDIVPYAWRGQLRDGHFTSPFPG